MRITYLQLALLFSIVFFATCRKIDFVNVSNDFIENKFFNNHVSNNRYIQACSNFISSQNNKYHFLKNVVKKIGYPIWDKSIVTNPKPSLSSKNQSDSTTLVFIPFVRESENRVNATLRISMSNLDTNFQFLCDWQYADTVNNGLSARAHSSILMALNTSVFDYHIYKITDSLAFPRIDSGLVKYVRINSFNDQHSTNRTTTTSKTEVLSTYTITVCETTWVPENEGQLVGCPPGPNCPDYQEVTTCRSYTFLVNEGSSSGGGGSPPPSGGGGGGSGGGWQLPQCDPQPTTTCNPGFEPVIYPPQPDPCDKVLPLTTNQEYIDKSMEFKNLLSNSDPDHEEAYIFDNLGFTKKYGPPNEDHVDLDINFLINGYFHFHRKHSKALPIFSVGDLLTIHQLLNHRAPNGTPDPFILPENFTLGVITKTGESYILVINDVVKFNKFCIKYFEYEEDRFELDNIYKKYKIHLANNAPDAETRFLKFVKDQKIGVEILKANNDFTGYSRLMLNENNIATVQPCL